MKFLENLLFLALCDGVLQTTKIGSPANENSHKLSLGLTGMSRGHALESREVVKLRMSQNSFSYFGILKSLTSLKKTTRDVFFPNVRAQGIKLCSIAAIFLQASGVLM
jgi:hypothetical protein